MTRFYIVRHGEIEWMPGDPGLTEKGQKQAAAVGEYLKEKGIERVYTSPLRRAVETGQIISGKLVEAVVQSDVRLHERMNWGDVSDQNWEEFDAEWDRATIDRDYVPLGGYSARQAAANMAEFLQENASQYPTAALAVVTHGGILGDYLTEHLQPADLESLHDGWASDKSAVILHCSVTVLSLDGQSPKLESLALIVE